MPTTRRLFASLLALTAAVAMRGWGADLPIGLWIPTGLLVAAALLVHQRHLGSQLLARAVLWSNLLLGALISMIGAHHERLVALVLAASTGAALLLVGRDGLEDDARTRSFVPLAFRATLTALMVMALADAQSLLLFGSLNLQGWPAEDHWRTAVFFALAGGLVLGIVGLYRLRLWGLLAAMASCVALVLAAAVGALRLPPVLTGGLIASAALQVILAAPLVVKLVTGGVRAAPPRLSRFGVVAGAVVIVALIALSAAFAAA